MSVVTIIVVIAIRNIIVAIVISRFAVVDIKVVIVIRFVCISWLLV